MEDVLQKQKELAPLINLLSPNIFLSESFAPLKDKNFKLFGQFSKDLSHVLIAFNNETSDFKAIIIDYPDMQQWKEFLQNFKVQDESEISYAILNTRDNQIEVASNNFVLTMQDINKLEEIFAALTHIKIMAGQIEYTKQEMEYLNIFLSNLPYIDKVNIRNVILDYVLSFKDYKRYQFEDSFLDDLLEILFKK